MLFWFDTYGYRNTIGHLKKKNTFEKFFFRRFSVENKQWYYIETTLHAVARSEKPAEDAETEKMSMCDRYNYLNHDNMYEYRFRGRPS